MEKIKINIRSIFLAALAAAVVIIWYALFYYESRLDLLVTFFDVGQGDAIFIEVPNGNQILIDGGPDDRILAKLGRTVPFWDRTIDLLILTHPHADHLNGLLEVAKRYQVATVIESGVPHSISEYEEWRTLLEKKRVPVTHARTGMRIDAGRGVAFDILAPAADAVVNAAQPHDANVVSRLTHGETSILLTGDAEKQMEYRLVFESLDPQFLVLDSDILKVGHHGSKTSSSEEFLAAVSPDIAIIQAGRKNRFGHPAPEVLERLETSGARILRTDRDGDIRFWSDGARYGLAGEIKR